MLLASWIITFLLIIGFGIYAGTRITKSDQWNGSDRSMGIFSVGAMLGAWQIGGMSIVGAAQNGYTLWELPDAGIPLPVVSIFS